MSEGADPAPTTPGQFALFIKNEIVKWATLLKLTDVNSNDE
ncbi:MAG TPA: hypothetical protein VGO08_15825 [Burkholderiales bacterium]|jgi:hypothetical protein|nr:hypothetical protein [Burkholderiales bacterium]